MVEESQKQLNKYFIITYKNGAVRLNFNRERTQGTQKKGPMKTDEIMKLCNQVRETAYAIHQYHGNGYLEKVYEIALVHRLRKMDLDVKQQYRLAIYDEDGTEIGEYFADLVIENELVIELKDCKSILDEHVSQLLNYLKASGKEHGLLINFGSYKFQIKKFAKSARTKGVRGSIALLLFVFSAFFCG